MSKQLRREWFSGDFADSEGFLAQAAGIEPGELDLSAVQALGAFKEIDPIVTDVLLKHWAIVEQWFLIGFILGQEPARLVLMNDTHTQGDSNNVDIE